MLYNQDEVVSSSQDDKTMSCSGITGQTISEVTKKVMLSDGIRGGDLTECVGTPPETLGVMSGRRHVNPQHKKRPLAKVPPFREEPLKKPLFPWMLKFNNICRESVGCQDYVRLDNLMEVFNRFVTDDVTNCYKKPNRATKLKNRMGPYLKYFYSLYKNTRKPLGVDHYKDRMSNLLSMYLDMEIRASRRGRELPKVISERLTSLLFVLLDDSKEHILNSILSAKFFRKCFNDICIPIIKSVVRDIPKPPLDKKTYFQYIHICKKWKNLVVKKEDISEEIKEIKKVTSKLVPPLEVILEAEKIYGLSCSSYKCPKENICMRYMRDSKFKYKQNTKSFFNSKSRKSLEEMLHPQVDSALPLFSEEKFHYSKNDPMIEKRFAIYLRHIWHEWNDLSGSSVEYDPTFPLYEESETCEQTVGVNQIFEKTNIENQDKEIIIVKDKECEKWPQSPLTGLGYVNSSIFHVSRYVSTNEDLVKSESNHNVDSGHMRLINQINTTSKMEADSQSQDEFIVISDDEEEYEVLSPVKVELEEKEVIDKNSRDLAHYLRLVKVTPTENSGKETIARNASMDSGLINSSAGKMPPVSEYVELSNQEKSLTVQSVSTEHVELSNLDKSLTVQSFSTEPIELSNLDKSLTVNEIEPKEIEKENQSTEEPIKVAMFEETQSPSLEEIYQPSPLSDAKTSKDLLLEDVSKEGAGQEGPPQCWSSEPPLESIFDPNDPNSSLIFCAGETGNTGTHDVTLADQQLSNFPNNPIYLVDQQDLFNAYECGNTNYYSDFYEQHDNMFPGFEFLNEDPMFCSVLMEDMHFNEKTNNSPESELGPQISSEVSEAKKLTVEKKGGRGRKSKIHTSSPTKAVEIQTEQNSKELAPEEDLCKLEKESHKLRKSARFISEEKIDNVKGALEQERKKRKTQHKKVVEDKPVPGVSSKSSTGKKQQKSTQPSPAKKKKGQGRKR